MNTRRSVLIAGSLRDRAEHRILRAAAARPGSARPARRSPRRSRSTGISAPPWRHELRAVEHRAGIDAAGLAEAAQEWREAVAARLSREQAPQRRASASTRACVSASSPMRAQILARDRAGELHARLPWLVGEVAQHADRGEGDAADQQPR